MATALTKSWKISRFVSLRNTTRCLLHLHSFHIRHGQKSYSSHLVWSGKVECFGKLRVSSGVDLHVKPSNALEGRQDLVSVYVISDSESISREIEDNFKDMVDCEVSNVNDEAEYSLVTINVDAGKNGPSIPDTSKLLIEVPHFYNLEANSSSLSELTVEKLEGDVKVQAVGDCFLCKLKSRLISVNTTQGSITGASSLIGDMVLTTGSEGHVTLEKLQGNNIKINCESGKVSIESLYGGSTVINTVSGDINIGDAHDKGVYKSSKADAGDISLCSTGGDMTVGSICGQLTAILDHGNIEAKVTNGGNIDATSSKGNATIKIDDDVRCRLDLRAKSVNISPDCQISEKEGHFLDDLVRIMAQTRGLGEQRVRINCPKGHLEVLKESWFVLPDTYN